MTMRVERLGHVNIRTPLFAETIAFYEDILGLRPGPGASAHRRARNVWMHDAGGRALIHVNGIEAGDVAHPAGPSGRLDHFALDCSGLDGFVARFEDRGIPYTRMSVAARGLVQLVVRDPNGLKVELTFADADENASA